MEFWVCCFCIYFAYVVRIVYICAVGAQRTYSPSHGAAAAVVRAEGPTQRMKIPSSLHLLSDLDRGLRGVARRSSAPAGLGRHLLPDWFARDPPLELASAHLIVRGNSLHPP